jgi:hypothetical protein
MSAYNPNFQMPQLGRQVNWGLDIQLPDYWKSVFTPDKSSKGTNTTPGQVSRDFPSIDYTSTGPAIPGVSPQFQEWLDFTKAMSPIRMQEQAQAAQLSAALTEQQLASLYPYLSQAAREATDRNLMASQVYRGFTELLPTTRQNIAASQQQQMSSAMSSKADMIRAVAAATQAAKSGKGYRGTTFSYA